jgi:pyruvate-ferredoxin/flavodoxin oxidoreductase
LDVASTIHESGGQRLVIGGRFGLGSKDLTGAQGKAIFDNLALASPKSHFTVGIEDDLTFTSIPVTEAVDSVYLHLLIIVNIIAGSADNSSMLDLGSWI